jgi:putative Mg2+ transporter-C (MgtC) family protein
MSSTIEWYDIAVRLLCSLVAGALIGINRTERGRSAGLRTTILVCLAASVAMILTNRLLSTHDAPADTFVRIDPMRLPLGILTGMGFIGAGAIIRRSGVIEGVTTAATMWFTTVIGLCFGSGHLVLGGVSFMLALGTLWGLQWFELELRRDRSAMLLVVLDPSGPTEDDIRSRLYAAGYRISSWNIAYVSEGVGQQSRISCEVKWHGDEAVQETPAIIRELARQAGVRKLTWKM